MVDQLDKGIVVALDFKSEKSALDFAAQADPSLCRLKIGKEMFTRFGPQLVKQLIAQGYDIFLDLKFHDIPNTVARAVEAAADLGVWMVNVHTLGGPKMMEAAFRALEPYGKDAPYLIGVTVLTSMDRQQLQAVGIDEEPQDQVLKLAELAQQCHLDGVVCSAQEAQALRSKLGGDFVLVTPGIRPAGSAAGDQIRIVTPQDAISYGSNYLVIGRPITQAPDPLAAVRQIAQSIGLIS